MQPEALPPPPPLLPTTMLAPMVRAGHLPLRLLALYHGAHTVFSEEIIALKLRKTTRIENVDLGTVDFCVSGGSSSKHTNTLVYRTCAMEKGRNVLQLGAAGATEAVEAALIVAQDVSCVDLNMGCPEKFSTIGGMGSALLRKPQVACEIIRALRTNLPSSVGVSCKIRLLDDVKDTITLMQSLEKAGAERITIHTRLVPERPRHPARWQEFQPLTSCVTIPVVANGDVFTLADALRFRHEGGATGAHGFMVARGAIADPAAAFSPFAYQDVAHVMDAYLSMSALVDNSFQIDKWFATQVVRYRPKEVGEKERSAMIAQSKTMEELLSVFSLPPRLTTVECWNARVPINTPEAWTMAINRALRPVWEHQPLVSSSGGGGGGELMLSANEHDDKRPRFVQGGDFM